MQKYAHVGYPKSGSTWLQLDLFPRHPDLFHLGRHNGDDIIDDDLRNILWNDLIAQPALLYEADRAAGVFDRLFVQAARAGKAACGISQEILTTSLAGNVDVTQRAMRLRGAIGPDTQIVMVVRNQLDWIRSMYCALLKEGGMTLEFDDFLFYFYYQQDQSSFSDLFYDAVYSLYADLFGARNVHVIPFELLRRDAGLFAREVCAAIGVRPPDEVSSRIVNPRLSPKALTAALEFNRQNRFYLGADQFRRPWAFAAASIFRTRFGIEPPGWVAAERQKSMFVFERIEAVVREAEARGRTIPPMNVAIPARYTRLLADAYVPHNRRLAELSGTDLGSLGYPV